MALAASDVRKIIQTDANDDTINVCIAAAAVITARIPTGGGTPTDPNPTPTEVIEIQRWLAAHFCALRTPGSRIDMFKIGGTAAMQESYGGKFGLGLDFSQYGQMAKTLDPTGTLKALDSKNLRARFRVIDFDESTYRGDPVWPWSVFPS
jgi:hypothetical protein